MFEIVRCRGDWALVKLPLRGPDAEVGSLGRCPLRFGFGLSVRGLRSRRNRITGFAPELVKKVLAELPDFPATLWP